MKRSSLQMSMLVMMLLRGELEAQQIEQRAAAAADMKVYVLLDKAEYGIQDPGWTIASDSGFVISDLFYEQRSEIVADTALVVAQSMVGARAVLRINGRMISPRQIRIDPQGENPLIVNGIPYAGALYIVTSDDTWYLVNGLELEDYVYSVLGSESWPGWPLEVDKVFAVMIRTYAVDKIIRARGRRRLGRGFLYDVVNTNMHQTYRGIHTRTALLAAVDATRGQILMHAGRPIEAMYDTCCGGIIPAYIQASLGREGEQIPPYLARSYPCTFCAECKAYSWSARYTREEALSLLRGIDPRIVSVQSVEVIRTDRAGIVHEVAVRSGRQTIKLTGKQLYTIFKDIKSFCFSIGTVGKHLIFTGSGYGHHRGLCQWGAREMIKQGWDYTTVLSFYYPETKITKLTRKASL